MDSDEYVKATEASARGNPAESLRIASMLETTAESPVERSLILLLRSTCYAQLNRISDALEVLTLARSVLEDRDLGVKLQIDAAEAWLHHLSGNYALAIAGFENIIHGIEHVLSGPGEQEFVDELMARYAYSLVHAEKYEEAIPVLRKLMTRDWEEQQQVLLFLGTALASTGRLDEGSEILEQASRGRSEVLRERAGAKLDVIKQSGWRSPSH